MNLGAGEMGQRVKQLAKTGGLSLVPRTLMEVEGENRLYRLSPDLHTWVHACAHTHRHTHTSNKIFLICI